MTQDERSRILEQVATIYAAGFQEGIDLVANEYELRDLIARAAIRMPRELQIRIDIVEESIKHYIEAIERKGAELKRTNMPPDRITDELVSYARTLTSRHAEMMAQTEYAKGRMDGATSIMDESGMEYEFRFPHFDLMTPGHEVCPICEAIAAGSPYSPEEAESQGYPDLPHWNCDHGWVIVPKGEKTRTEEFPQGPAVTPYPGRIHP